MGRKEKGEGGSGLQEISETRGEEELGEGRREL